MSDVKMITPAQERTLSDALVSAIKSVNSGMAPNDALAKSANEHGLTPQFACRMTEAYNASKTVRYLQSTEGEKRAENFDLADRDTVLKLMYAPGTEKVAYAKPTSMALGKFYTVEGATRKNLEKAAGDKAPTMFAVKLQDNSVKKPKPKKMPALHTVKMSKLAGLKLQLKNMGDDIRMELRHAKDQIYKAACALESTLRVPGHEPFEEIEKRVLSTYGGLGKKAMDIVWGMCDFERFGEKRASHPGRLLVLGTGPAYDCVRDMMSWVEKAARVDAEMKEWEEKSKQVDNLLPESAGQQPGGTGATFVSDPGMPRRPATAPLVDVAKEIGEGASNKETPEQTVSKAAAVDAKPAPGFVAPGLPSEASGIMNTLMGGGAPESLFDPQQEAKLRAIRAKMVMNDMISNDPVLSAYPPEAVTGAYNELARMAPGVSTEPLAMRSLIGRSLVTGGRMEPSEIKQLLEAEQEHRNIRVKGY